MTSDPSQDHVEVTRNAELSPCGLYRYWLWRKWSDGGKRVTFVMLNPSTADALMDDPTIRKCVGFAKRLGFDELFVVNLFAYRATEPKELQRVGWRIAEGPANDNHTATACMLASLVIAAWGATDFRNAMVAYRARVSRGQSAAA